VQDEADQIQYSLFWSYASFLWCAESFLDSNSCKLTKLTLLEIQNRSLQPLLSDGLQLWNPMFRVLQTLSLWEARISLGDFGWVLIILYFSVRVERSSFTFYLIDHAPIIYWLKCCFFKLRFLLILLQFFLGKLFTIFNGLFMLNFF